MAVSRAPASVGIQLGIIVLTLATAIIHFYLVPGYPNPFAAPFPLLFMLNGLGYLMLLGALYLPIPQLEGYRSIVRIVLITYTAITIVGYFVSNGLLFFPVGYIDKLIEVALIVLLIVDMRSERGN